MNTLKKLYSFSSRHRLLWVISASLENRQVPASGYYWESHSQTRHNSGLCKTELYYSLTQQFPDSSVDKESTCNAGDSSLTPRSGRSTGEGIDYLLQLYWASLMAQPVKNLPAMQETWVQSLGWEDPLVWWIPRTTVHGVAKSGIQLSDFHLHSSSSIGYWGLMR